MFFRLAKKKGSARGITQFVEAGSPGAALATPGVCSPPPRSRKKCLTLKKRLQALFLMSTETFSFPPLVP